MVIPHCNVLLVLSRYLIGATAARSGDESSGPALLLLGLSSSTAVTGSALLAALTIAAAFGGPVLGAVLDRARSPGRVLATALAGYAVGLALITVAFGRVPFALVLATAALAGLLNPAVAGGWTAQLPALVPPERLPRASTLDAMTFTAASLAGPGLAGLLANLAGAPFALTFASVLVAAAVPVAWHLPRRAERPRNPQKLAVAALVLVRNRPLRRATVTTTLSYAGIGMAMVCYPVLGIHRLGGAGYGTLLLTVMAVASLLANALLARRPPLRPPDTTVLLSTIVLGAGFLAAAAAPNAILLVAAAVLIGFGEGPQLAAVFAVRHREAPADVRAQVFTTAASVKIAGMAAGTAFAGPFAGQSPTACLCAAAGCNSPPRSVTWCVHRRPGRGTGRRLEGHRLRAALDLGAVARAERVHRGRARQRVVLREEPAQHLGAAEAGVREHGDRARQALDHAVLDEEGAGHEQLAAAFQRDQLAFAQHLAHLVDGSPERFRHLRQRKNRDLGVEHVVGDRYPTHR